MTSKIAILTHERQQFESGSYLLHPLLSLWAKSGIEIVVLRGPKHYEPADALFMHIDLTVIPEEYEHFSQRYPVVINGLVKDISKRHISTLILGRKDNYQGPVLVKTNRNFGGGMEKRLVRRTPFSRLAKKLQKRLPWYWKKHLSPDNYPIFSGPGQVPKPVWWNRHLVVEKFLPEREGNHFALRQWVFFGDREMSQRVVSPNPIVKARNILSRETGIAIPDDLRKRRKDLGFDYGKFDFVQIDGQTILLDANRTPSFNIRTPTPAQAAMLEHLAAGVFAYLPSRDRFTPVQDNAGREDRS